MIVSIFLSISCLFLFASPRAPCKRTYNIAQTGVYLCYFAMICVPYIPMQAASPLLDESDMHKQRIESPNTIHMRNLLGWLRLGWLKIT